MKRPTAILSGILVLSCVVLLAGPHRHGSAPIEAEGLSLKDTVSLVSEIVSTLAIVVGGIYAFWRWGLRKPEKERAVLSHEISSYEIDPNHRLVHVVLKIENQGEVRLKLRNGFVAIRRIIPFQGGAVERLAFADNKIEFAWPDIEERVFDAELLDFYVDTGETDCLFSDFIIPGDVKVILVRSEVRFSKTDPGEKYPISTMWDFEAEKSKTN